MSRMDAITDAAITTIAREGLRGLTHRAVDRAAGLPEGSCSYYFRTRQALLEGTVARLADVDAGLLAPLGRAPSLDLDHLADLMAGMVEQALTSYRDRFVARYELSLEATRRPELRDTLRTVGARYREAATALLAAIGAPDPERRGADAVAYLDGFVYDAIAGAGARPFDRTAVRRSMRELLQAMTSRTN